MTALIAIAELFWTFFKIGAFTFGGGYAMLPLVQQAVIEHGWLSEGQIIDFIAVSESTPGPFAINIATYVGSQRGAVIFETAYIGEIIGAFAATLGVVLPSFIIILIVAKCFERFKKSKIVSGCMSGLKPAVIGLISSALITMGMTVFFRGGISIDAFKSEMFYICFVIFALMTALSQNKKVSPVYIIIVSAVLGIAAGYIFDIQI